MALTHCSVPVPRHCTPFPPPLSRVSETTSFPGPAPRARSADRTDAGWERFDFPVRRCLGFDKGRASESEHVAPSPIDPRISFMTEASSDAGVWFLISANPWGALKGTVRATVTIGEVRWSRPPDLQVRRQRSTRRWPDLWIMHGMRLLLMDRLARRQVALRGGVQ